MISKNHFSLFEHIERRVMDDFFRYAPETTRRRLGLQTADIADARLYLAGNENSVLLNRVLGLGSTKPINRQDIEKIQQIYTSNQVEQYFVMVQPWLQPARAWSWLFEQSLERDRGWTLFMRGTEVVKTASSRLRIESIGPEYANDFARIVADGFDLSPNAWPALEALVGKPGWHHFMSFSGSTLCGRRSRLVRLGRHRPGVSITGQPIRAVAGTNPEGAGTGLPYFGK